MGEVTQRTYNNARVVGYLGTGGTALIIFLILFFTYLVTPIPPYPEGGGGKGMEIEVNLGFSDAGFGDMQQANLALPDFKEEVKKQPAPAEEPKQEVLSQENEETATITNPPKTKKKITPAVKTPVTEKTAKPKEKTPEVEKPRVPNKAALYKPNNQSGTTTSQGVTKGSGDQGDPNGSKSSAIYGKGGTGGDGTGGGSGGGSGGGTGTGVGTGVGPGISFNLEGRSMVLIRKPDFSIQKEGIVVVEITVDKTGKVISAKPGVKGSTIVDNTLYASAKKAALESKFNLKEDAPDLQVGKLVYHFKLQ